MSALRPRYATVVFDVDSTLAKLEGIDWLAELRGETIARECADLTTRAMAGEFPIEAVYTRRLKVIAPTADELVALGDVYRAAVMPGAATLIAALHSAGCTVRLLSGGLRTAILPLAEALGVPADHVHAVELIADEHGTFTRLNGTQPLATQPGKAQVLDVLNPLRPSVIIGDGSTDAAARSAVDAFIAFTGVARRDTVVAAADAEAADFATLQMLLFESFDEARGS